MAEVVMRPRGFAPPGDPRANVRLLGRSDECAVLDRLVEAVRLGESRALVVSGEPGAGKTALLDYLGRRASAFRVARVSGVASEMQLAFSGLHQLCAPLLNRLERLPGPQRDALGTTFGLCGGPAPNRFLVGLATLGLLTETARESPLVCVIDDAHCLDSASAQALAFVARRLVAESVALVFATRDPDEVPELTGLSRLMVEGLPEADARTLLRSALHGPVDEAVLERIIAETRGNPLALSELPWELTPMELAGAFGLPAARELPASIEELYRRRVVPLPAETRRLLLIAAAEPVGDPVLVWRAAERSGIGVEAAAPATDDGLLEFGERVRFRHPLLRSAIYRAAPTEDRRAACRALADVTDPGADPDRRAWHAAQAASGPGEEIAAELERSAGRAHARGSGSAAAAFLKRAAELTPEPARRAQRALAAALTIRQAGMPDAALRMLALAESGPLDELARARADLIRGRIAFTDGRASEAAMLLRGAATKLEPLDARLARDTHLEATWAAWFVGQSSDNAQVRDAALAARAAPPAPDPQRPVDLLLDGLAIRLTDGYAAGLPTLRRALSAFRGSALTGEEGLRWLWLACANAAHMWDDEAWEELAIRQLRLARDSGDLAVLLLALTTRIMVHTHLGELSAAASLAGEQEAVVEATRSRLVPHGLLWVTAWQGREADAEELIGRLLRRRAVPGSESWPHRTVIAWAKALVHNSLGRYEEALAVAQPAGEHSSEMCPSSWGMLVELIEAAVRSGLPERAVEALRQLTAATAATGTEWALGVQARCRALCSDGELAETAYREAISRLGRTRVRGELARAHLLYGEWLRRQNRRLDAREQLRTAHAMFGHMGMDAFAQRAAHELQITGDSIRKRVSGTNAELSQQETQIVRLVGEGLTNPEVAARLFISPRTVEWHLNKIFSKLNITSRRQLRRPGAFLAAVV